MTINFYRHVQILVFNNSDKTLFISKEFHLSRLQHSTTRGPYKYLITKDLWSVVLLHGLVILLH